MDVGTFWCFSEHLKNSKNLVLSHKALIRPPSVAFLRAFKARNLFSNVIAPTGSPTNFIEIVFTLCAVCNILVYSRYFAKSPILLVISLYGEPLGFFWVRTKDRKRNRQYMYKNPNEGSELCQISRHRKSVICDGFAEKDCVETA